MIILKFGIWNSSPEFVCRLPKGQLGGKEKVKLPKSMKRISEFLQQMNSQSTKEDIAFVCFVQNALSPVGHSACVCSLCPGYLTWDFCHLSFFLVVDRQRERPSLPFVLLQKTLHSILENHTQQIPFPRNSSLLKDRACWLSIFRDKIAGYCSDRARDAIDYYHLLKVMNKIKSKWRRLMNIVKINGGSSSGGSAGGWVKYVTESGRDSEHSPTFPTFSTSAPPWFQKFSKSWALFPLRIHISLVFPTPAAWTNSGSNSLFFKAMASWIRMRRAQKPEGIIFSKANYWPGWP